MYHVVVERALDGMFEHSVHPEQGDAYNAASSLYDAWKFLHKVDFALSAVRVCVVGTNGDVIFKFGNI